MQASGTDKDLLSVFFANAHDGWAVGADGMILAIRDRGKELGAEKERN